MIGTLARKRTHLVGLATLLALVAAMFVVLAPASAHDLGECSNPEYLTQAKCEEETWDHDDDTNTAEVSRHTWTQGTHTAANHPPTVSVVVLDSDRIVPDDSTVKVAILVSGIRVSATKPSNNDEPSSYTATDVALDYVRVSGELEYTGPIPTFDSTPNLDDDITSLIATADIVIPAGTTAREYTVSAEIKPATDANKFWDYSGNEVKSKSAKAKFTVGDAGIGLVSPATLSLGNRVPDDPATLTDESKAESGKDSATGNGINLVVTTTNGIGNKSNNSDVEQITVIAPGGDIEIKAPMVDDVDDAARPHAKRPLFTAVTEDNSSSLDEDVARADGSNGTTLTGDAIRQTMHINVNKADDEPGTVDVYVIFAGDGAAISNTITLTFTGPNDALSIGDPSDSLLAFTEVTTLPDVLRRDIVTFALGATDEGGNAGSVPDLRTRILDPDGKVVNQEKIKVDQLANSAGVPNTVLKITSLPSYLEPLKTGTYSIRVSSTGGLSATGSFVVVGRANSVELSVDTLTPSTVGEIVTATVTVKSGDVLVPNGTQVTFRADDVAADADAVLRAVGGGVEASGNSVQRTIGGEATATFVTVGHGSSVVSATAHRTTDVEVLESTAGAPAVVEPEAVDCSAVGTEGLSATNGFATWSHDDCGTSASALFESLSGRGASAIHLWNGSAWVRYSVVDGAEVPGSSNFDVMDGDIVYISN